MTNLDVRLYPYKSWFGVHIIFILWWGFYMMYYYVWHWLTYCMWQSLYIFKVLLQLEYIKYVFFTYILKYCKTHRATFKLAVTIYSAQQSMHHHDSSKMRITHYVVFIMLHPYSIIHSICEYAFQIFNHTFPCDTEDYPTHSIFNAISLDEKT